MTGFRNDAAAAAGRPILWPAGWRAAALAGLDAPWDIVVVGGGITGAGVFLEAARRGLRTLLVEQRDFAWGTSSRSSKLVHGGLRYLKEGQIGVTRDSVREREALLAGAPGLVRPQPFLLPLRRGRKPGRALLAAGLTVYDWLAGSRTRRAYSPAEVLALAPGVGRDGLTGGLGYLDAKTDDARLVLRVIEAGVAAGGVAINHFRVAGLVRDADGRVVGVDGVDNAARIGPDEGAGVGEDPSAAGTGTPGGARYRIAARVVVNAGGAWASAVGARGVRLRPLRGSHLMFPAWRLPVAQAVSFFHPRDGRPVFAYPWEGATLLGTTDVDHRADLDREPAITADEAAYLIEAVRFQFPDLDLTAADAVASFAGVRPVIDTGAADPSKEGRDHLLTAEPGLVSVTGGKLTTFRLSAMAALALAAKQLGRKVATDLRPLFAPGEWPAGAPALPAGVRQRLLGRYGDRLPAVLAAAAPGDFETIPGSEALWLELRWAARAEAVVHLDDLLLRRLRLGLLLPEGGAGLARRIRAVAQPELGWDDARWDAEWDAYRALWQRCYAPPGQMVRGGGAPPATPGRSDRL